MTAWPTRRIGDMLTQEKTTSTKQLELHAIYQCMQLLKTKHAAIQQANAAPLPATLESMFAASPATAS